MFGRRGSNDALQASRGQQQASMIPNSTPSASGWPVYMHYKDGRSCATLLMSTVA